MGKASAFVAHAVTVGVHRLHGIHGEGVRVVAHAVAVGVHRLRGVHGEGVRVVAHAVHVGVHRLRGVHGEGVRVVAHAVHVGVHRLTLTGRAVDALAAADRDVIFWDRELAGFGVRVYPSGRKVYVVQSRAGGGPRRVTLGTHGEITATQARLRAAQVIDRIKRGEEPAVLPPQAGTTVADLAERYLSAHVAQNCNAHTAGIYRGSLENHILPALGMMPLAMVESAHVAALPLQPARDPARRQPRALGPLQDVLAGRGLGHGGRRRQPLPRRAQVQGEEARGASSHATSTGGWARRWRRRRPTRRRARTARSPPTPSRRCGLLMLTGCRLNEILTLRWDDVDRTAGEFRLRDGKTGARMVPLTPTADAVLAGIERVPRQPLDHSRQAARHASHHHHR